MRRLFHYPLCAFSRAIRFVMCEKKLDYELVYETPWDPSDELFEHSITGSIPVLIDINGNSIYGFSAIREYLDEVYPQVPLISGDEIQKAESRKIADWFCFEFYKEVYFPIYNEKIVKRFDRDSARSPDPAALRCAGTKLALHMEYIDWLIDRRNWLAGRDFSIADVYAAAFISTLDYFGIIHWEKFEIVKNWYARIKSRPAFKSILQDHLSQISPSENYINLDF